MNSKTLMIYDMNGIIIRQISGDYIIPSGLPFIEVVIPTGEYAVYVNVETKEPVYADTPKNEIDLLQDDVINLTKENTELKSEQVKMKQEQADLLFTLMENNVL